jgi:prepilin-type N-terminal cleavage/methylation domain-containing protein
LILFKNFDIIRINLNYKLILKKMFNKKGFTLIEVLLVVVIIAILAAIVLIAVNPGRQVAQSNNTQRRADIQSVLNAIGQYTVDNRGALPSAITTTATTIGSGAGEIDVCADLVPLYIAGMPFDPTGSGAHFTDCTDYNTGYSTVKDANNRVTISAPNAELGETISVTR